MVTKLTYAALIGFFLAVGVAQFSGNDKFPFFTILILIFNCVMLVVNFIKFGINPSDKSARLNMGLGVLLMLYVASVIYLSRVGMVDSMMFLGFR